MLSEGAVVALWLSRLFVARVSHLCSMFGCVRLSKLPVAIVEPRVELGLNSSFASFVAPHKLWQRFGPIQEKHENRRASRRRDESRARAKASEKRGRQKKGGCAVSRRSNVRWLGEQQAAAAACCCSALSQRSSLRACVSLSTS